MFFQIFISKTFKLVDFRSIIFSICYAFCGFMAAYGTYHIMWLDAFLLLPLLCYFVYYSFINDKYAVLVILYAYLFISHFYMGYMVGIYSLLFFAGLIFINPNKLIKKDLVKRIFKWI